MQLVRQNPQNCCQRASSVSESLSVETIHDRRLFPPHLVGMKLHYATDMIVHGVHFCRSLFDFC